MMMLWYGVDFCLPPKPEVFEGKEKIQSPYALPDLVSNPAFQCVVLSRCFVQVQDFLTDLIRGVIVPVEDFELFVG